MINEDFMYLAVSLTLFGNLRYAYSTYRGKTRPSLITWSLWVIIPLVMFFAQQSEGVTIQSLLSLFVGTSPLLIIVCAIMKNHFTLSFTKIDISCALISAIAIIIWVITGKGNLAIILSIVAGFVAGIPTIVHGYKLPQEENTTPFILGMAAAAITILTVQSFSISSTAFAGYLLVSNMIITSTIYYSKASNQNKIKQ